MLILVSDLLTREEDVFKTLKMLKSRGLEVVLFHVLHPDEVTLPFEGDLVFESLEDDPPLGTGSLRRAPTISESHSGADRVLQEKLPDSGHRLPVFGNHHAIGTGVTVLSSPPEKFAKDMNFSFTSPWYLLGLLGLALPILIHLLTRRQQTRLKFSAVYLLQQAQKRAVRKSRPNKLLLLLLRCLAIGFLCLALANPIMSSGGLESVLTSRPTAHVFILDDSFSMSAASDPGTLFDRATQTLTELIEKLPANHTYSLVLASNPSRLVQDGTGDPGKALKWLKAAQPSHRTTSIGKAVTVAADLLSTAPQESKRIFILTDMDQNGWDRDEFPTTFAEDSRIQIKIIDFSGHQKGINRALVQKVKLNQEFLTNRRIIRGAGDGRQPAAEPGYQATSNLPVRQRQAAERKHD